MTPTHTHLLLKTKTQLRDARTLLVTLDDCMVRIPKEDLTLIAARYLDVARDLRVVCDLLEDTLGILDQVRR